MSISLPALAGAPNSLVPTRIDDASPAVATPAPTAAPAPAPPSREKLATPPIGFQGSDAQRARQRDAAMRDYGAIQSQLVLDGGSALRVRERAGSDAPATAWPHGQVVAAALDRALVGGDVNEARKALAGLKRFEAGSTGSFNPTEGGGTQDRFYDDNAWIGLDYMQGLKLTSDGQYLDDAKRVFSFLEQGLHADGGLLWKENEPNPARAAASMGPTMQLALQLYRETGEQHYMDVAKNIDGAQNRLLRNGSGLIMDNVKNDGHVDDWVFSYNQGTSVGADVQFYDATGDTKYLDRAKSTASAALDFFARDDQLWKQPPAFNAIMFRNLLKLDAVAPDPRIRATLERYVARAEQASRQDNGLYAPKDGMGQYEGKDGATSVIDQAAMVQMHALLAMTPEQLATVA